MTMAKEFFHLIATVLPDGKGSKMLGALCSQAPYGKSGVMFKNELMIFKLQGETEEKALKPEGAK